MADQPSELLARGLAHSQRGELQKAKIQYKAAFRGFPGCAPALHMLGLIAAQEGDLQGSVHLIGQALALSKTGGAYSDLGGVLGVFGRPAESERACRAALDLDANAMEARRTLGKALYAQGRREAAAEIYQDAWARDPADLQSAINLGIILQELMQPDQSLKVFDEVLKGDPSNAQAHFNRGNALFRLGRLEEAVLAYRRALLIFPTKEPINAHCPLFSLPGVFQTNEATIPQTPYLRADRQLRSFWAERLNTQRFKVGLVWQGDPGSPVERVRSIPLSMFAPLAQQGVELISLQKAHGLDQLEHLDKRFALRLLGDDYEIGDFAVTAAVIANLDLVICCDTAVAHLAGALGQPVWLLVNAVCDWRWLQNRSDSPWYHSMRIHRRSEPSNWTGVLARVAADLSSEVVRRSP